MGRARGWRRDPRWGLGSSIASPLTAPCRRRSAVDSVVPIFVVSVAALPAASPAAQLVS